MIESKWVFDDAYETDILHRHEELRSLSRLLGRTQDGLRAADVLIHGPSGVGKTATARWMLRDLRQRAAVNSVLVECSGKTGNEIMREVIDKYPEGTVVHRNQPREELVATLERIVDEPLIVVLDEADIIPDLDVLEDLFAVDLVSVIAITHQQVEWLNRIDRELRPHFHGDSQIEFRKYNTAELVDILKPRIERGLIGDPTQDGHLEWIADETNGVARWAIKTVLSAAELAFERGHDRFQNQDVEDAFERAKRKIREANLKSLAYSHHAIYELVRRLGPTVYNSELKSAYRAHREEIYAGRHRDPVGWRQVRNYLEKLEKYDLIKREGTTQDRRYTVIDPDLEATVDLDFVFLTP